MESKNTDSMAGKKFKHFKGREYLVLHIAKHSETMEDMVVYQALYGKMGIWVRPLAMFFEKVNIDGKIVSRFEETPISQPLETKNNARNRLL